MKQLLIVFSSCLLVACAGSETAPDGEDSPGSGGRRDCISTSSVRGYSVLDDANLIVDAGGRRKYHVTLRRPAYGIRSSMSIGFKSPTGLVCSGFDQIVFQDRFDGDSVRIASIRQLSPEEHEHLLIQYGKMEPEIEQTPVPREVSGAEVEELDPAARDESSGD